MARTLPIRLLKHQPRRLRLRLLPLLRQNLLKTQLGFGISPAPKVAKAAPDLRLPAKNAGLPWSTMRRTTAIQMRRLQPLRRLPSLRSQRLRRRRRRSLLKTQKACGTTLAPAVVPVAAGLLRLPVQNAAKRWCTMRLIINSILIQKTPLTG